MKTRPKGTPKSGGRIKSTPNKRSLELLKGLMAYECIPTEQLAQLLLSPDLCAAEKMACWEKLLPYLFPAQKAIDPDGYLSVQQVGGMMASQAIKFRDMLAKYNVDAIITGAILDDLRPKGDS